MGPASRTLVVLSTLALMLALVPLAATADPSRGVRGEYRPSEILIGFHVDASEAERDRVRKRHRLEKLRDLPVPGLELNRIRDRGSPPQRADAVAAEPAVSYAEPNFIYHTDEHAGDPDDPRFHDQYSFHNFGQSMSNGVTGTADADIDWLEAWREPIPSAEDIVVGVIDTGTMTTHVDLAANIALNCGELPAAVCDGTGLIKVAELHGLFPGTIADSNTNGYLDAEDVRVEYADNSDNDLNGYTDDIAGWDFYSDDPGVYDSRVHDDHGTHVSGTISALTDNGVGVAGISNAKILPLKFIGPPGGSTADAIDALDYAIDNGAHLTSNSWGGGSFSQALKDKIDEAHAAGDLFIAAAGNSSAEITLSSPRYPCSYQVANVVCVASTDHNDALSGFSNYGGQVVHLGAPGSHILSTIPDTSTGSYDFFGGTSMATPHVSGVAAVATAFHPGKTHTEIKQLLMDTGDPLASLDGKTISGRRLNVYNTLHETVPMALDTTFSGDGKTTTSVGTSSASNVPFDVAVDGNGRIVSAGQAYDGSDRDVAVTRVNSDGTLDTGFGDDGTVTVDLGSTLDAAEGVAIQGDGKIVVAGYLWNGTNSNFDVAVVRLNTDGTLDGTFDSDGIAILDPAGSTHEYGLDVTVHGSTIIVVGAAKVSGNYDFLLARTSDDGNNWSFTTTPVGTGHDFAYQAVVDGSDRILVAGAARNADNDTAVVRYYSSGALDTGWGTSGKAVFDLASGANDFATGVVLDGSSRPVISGVAHNGSDWDVLVAALAADGSGVGWSASTSIGSGHDVALGLGIDSTGSSILAAGSTQTSTGFEFALVRYDTTSGTFDRITRTDVGSGHDYGRAVSVEGGRAVVAGTASNGNGGSDFGVAAYQP